MVIYDHVHKVEEYEQRYSFSITFLTFSSKISNFHTFTLILENSIEQLLSKKDEHQILHAILLHMIRFYLKFDPRKTILPEIKNAPLLELIESLLISDHHDFIDNWLFTFRSYLSPLSFLSLLILRFLCEPNSEKRQEAIQLR